MIAQEKLAQRLTELETPQLEEVVIELFNDDRDSATTALDYALAELEIRLTEDEFVIFCNQF